MYRHVLTRQPAIRVPYYRLKKSYRDVPGHVHSLILINIGFEPSLTAVQVQKIAFALIERFKDSGTNPLFDKQPEGLRRDCTMIGVKLGLMTYLS